MVVLFPFVGDSVGGSHISTLELYYALIDKKITALIVLHVHDGPLAKYLRNKNIPFYVLKPSALAGSSPKKIDIIVGIISNFFNFVKFIKKYKIDIVHGNDLRVNLSWSIPAKIYTKGFVWHQRTLLSDSKLWFLIRYMCNYFIAISNAVMQSAPININNNKKQIIYNPFNVDSTTNKKLERKCIFDRYSLPQDCFLIGCVGRIVDYKNIDYVINNICNIRKKSNKNVYLIIDEAYFPFSEETSIKLIKKYKRLAIIRTGSKSFGLAGLRVGFIASNKYLINLFSKFKFIKYIKLIC